MQRFFNDWERISTPDRGRHSDTVRAALDVFAAAYRRTEFPCLNWTQGQYVVLQNWVHYLVAPLDSVTSFATFDPDTTGYKGAVLSIFPPVDIAGTHILYQREEYDVAFYSFFGHNVLSTEETGRREAFVQRWTEIPIGYWNDYPHLTALPLLQTIIFNRTLTQAYVFETDIDRGGFVLLDKVAGRWVVRRCGPTWII